MLTVGEKFLRYKLLSLIGSGGMGEVYLAKDEQLERRVAIKVLGKRFGQVEDKTLERFMQEARAASALNHPNIITIYEIGEWEGSPYIASEFIEGVTLHQKLSRRTLSLAEKLNITVQIAEALTAAHAAGIIHRDIKPENVMIREDGYVKVLDFGLAKLTENGRGLADVEADTMRMVATDPGTILGTVAYMSPEQTRGKTLDGRTDIWSLGVVMYEMLTGKRPFEGETSSDVIAAILKSDPAPITAEIPRTLERIVTRTLEKDRDERYQHIKDLLIDLKDCRREHAGGRDPERHTSGADHHPFAVAPDTGGGRRSTGRFVSSTKSIRETLANRFKGRPLVSASLTILLLAAAAAGVYAIRRVWSGSGTATFEAKRFTRLTSSGDAEAGLIAISGDGKYVAYVAKEGGRYGLWVRQTQTTGNVQVVPGKNMIFSGITFSNDGDYIYYSASERGSQTSAVFSVATLGGVTRKVVDDAAGPISFSSDGKHFGFVRNDTDLMVVNADGTNERPIAKAAPGENYSLPAWSPDDRAIAIRVGSTSLAKIWLQLVSIGDGAVTPIASTEWLSITGVAWLPDAGSLIVSGRDKDRQYSQLWLLSTQNTGLNKITNDLGNYFGVGVSRDGRTIVSVQESRLANIWIAGRGSEPQKVTTDLGRDDGLSGIAVTPDGKVVYTTRPVGMIDVSIVDPAEGVVRQLTADSGMNFYPSVSPDGRTIAFISDRAGKVDLWTMGMDGRTPVQLTNTPGVEGMPAYTPDGRWIVYQYFDENREFWLYKIPAGGGQPVPIAGPGASRPAISLDGRRIFFRSEDDKGRRGAIVPFDGGDTTLIDQQAVASSPVVRWSDDGTELLYIEPKAGAAIIAQPLSGGPPKTVVEAGGDRIYFFTTAPGGGLVFSKGREPADAVLIRGYE